MFNFFKSMLEKMRYDEIEQVANKAKDYARKQIIKGSTQLENNLLEKEYDKALGESLEELRKLYEDNSIYDLEKNDICFFEKVIGLSSKYSLGNCMELSFHTFDYILYNTEITRKKVNVEIYQIKGKYSGSGDYLGDHVFLVLNRSIDSNPSKPETWGENAIICDPWANKIFNACEYRKNLGNYYRKNDKNCTSPFSPMIHLLQPLPNMNTTYFEKYRNINKLKMNFQKLCKTTIALFENENFEQENDLNEKSKEVITKLKDLQNIDLTSGPYRSVKKMLIEKYDEVLCLWKEAKRQNIKINSFLL